MKSMRTMVVAMALCAAVLFAPVGEACSRYLMTQDANGNVIVCSYAGEDVRFCYYAC
jgi:hypothetical protein